LQRIAPQAAVAAERQLVVEVERVAGVGRECDEEDRLPARPPEVTRARREQGIAEVPVFEPRGPVARDEEALAIREPEAPARAERGMRGADLRGELGAEMQVFRAADLVEVAGRRVVVLQEIEADIGRGEAAILRQRAREGCPFGRKSRAFVTKPRGPATCPVAPQPARPAAMDIEGPPVRTPAIHALTEGIAAFNLRERLRGHTRAPARIK
jgi:hypothetical protein